MIKKVIIFVENYLNKRDYDRFGIKILEDNGFDVEVWSFVKILFGGQKIEKIHVENHITTEVKYHVLEGISDYSHRLKKVNRKTTIVINHIHIPILYYKSHYIYMYLLLYRIKYCFYSAVDPVIMFVENSFVEQLYKILINYILFHPKVNFLCTQKSDNKILKKRTVKNIYTHSSDYDTHLHYQKEKSQWEARDYVIFIDEYYPFHPDYKFFNTCSPIKNINLYYIELCNFFEVIEKNYDTKVVIAAHPRANYRDKPDYFEGREIEYGKTRELIQHSKFVIAYETTALSYVVIYNKPFIYITHNDLIMDHVQGRYIKMYSGYFRKKPLNLSKNYSDVDFDSLAAINKKTYAKYKQEYIKMKGTINKCSIQVVADYIKEI